MVSDPTTVWSGESLGDSRVEIQLWDDGEVTVLIDPPGGNGQDAILSPDDARSMAQAILDRVGRHG